MADDIATETETNGTTKHAPATRGDMIPKFRFDEANGKASNAAAERDAALAQLAEYKSKFDSMTSEFDGFKSGHSQELYLMEQGFKAPSVRRFFKREYTDAVKGLGADERPSFGDWLEASKDDPLYSVHFDRNAPSPQEGVEDMDAAPVNIGGEDNLLAALRAAMGGNPDANVGQPTSNRQREWTAEAIRALRTKNGGKINAKDLEGIIGQWRAKGAVK